jgi:tetratricopeptide (TPR) repeat protein
MGRFSKLDFDAGTARPAPREETEDDWPAMDEAGCMHAGDDAFDAGLYEAALTAYSRALRFNKSLPSAWLGQVRCLICMGEYPEAVTWSDRALEKFFNSPDLLACKGLALVLGGQVAKGMEFLDGAVALRSPSAWVWLARGEGLLRTNQPEANAARCLLKALELSPEDWRTEMRVGMIYNGARLYASARSPLLSALRRVERGRPHGRADQGSDCLLLYHLGITHEGLGELSAAAGYFQRAVASRRSYAEAEQALSRVQATGVFSKLWRQIKARK